MHGFAAVGGWVAHKPGARGIGRIGSRVHEIRRERRRRRRTRVRHGAEYRCHSYHRGDHQRNADERALRTRPTSAPRILQRVREYDRFRRPGTYRAAGQSANLVRYRSARTHGDMALASARARRCEGPRGDDRLCADTRRVQ